MQSFFILALLFYASITHSKTPEEPLLFPELSGFSNYKEMDKNGKNAISIPNENLLPEENEGSSVQEQDLFSFPENSESSSLEEKKEEVSEEQEEERDDDQNQQIMVTFNNINATLSPNRNASFCSGNFFVGNALKKELKSFSGTFTIGSTTKKFDFKNVAKQNAIAVQYIFLGTSCEQILNDPQINIQTCQVEGWSEKKCREKVKFIPVPKSESMSLK